MKTNMKKFFTLALVILLCSFYKANATTFLVTNTNDAGAGSLRQAIADADANPGRMSLMLPELSAPST